MTSKNYPLATRLDRLLAALIDELLVMGIYYVLTRNTQYSFVIDETRTYSYMDMIIVNLILTGIYVFLNLYLWNKYGQSIGKRLVGLAIVNQNDDRILSLGRLLLYRYLPFWLLIFVPLLGRIIIMLDIAFIFRPDKRCIHDHLAQTRVINVRRRKDSGASDSN